MLRRVLPMLAVAALITGANCYQDDSTAPRLPPIEPIIFAVQPRNQIVNYPLTPAVQVAIVDTSGKTDTTATNAVTVAIGTNAAGGSLSGTTTVNAVRGIAAFADLSIDRAATGYTLVPHSGNVTGASSKPFNVVGPSAGPAIALTPSSVTFSAAQFGANPAPQTISVTNVGAGTLSGLALLPGGGGSGWLSASLSGTTAPATVTLNVTTTSLAPGTYTVSDSVVSSVATNNPQIITVTFVVGPPATPVIALSPSGVSFTAMAGGPTPAAQTINVTNGGGGTLNGLAVGTVTYGAGQATGWLGASLSGTTAPATLTLSVTTMSLLPGTYTASVPVTSSVASNSPQPAAVTLVVTGPPAIGLTPASVRFGALPGGANPAGQTVLIRNCGGQTLSGLAVGTISYGAGQPTGWLGVSLSGTTAPATLTLSVTTGGLAAGTYTASVPVTSSVASNSPQTVSVTFVVDPSAPIIALTPSSVRFLALYGYDSGDSATVSVTNGGGGTLSGLAVGTITSGCGSGSGFFSVGLSGTTAPATLKVRVGVGFRTRPGTYTATVPLTSTVATNSPQYLELTVTVQ
jgi:hypothetical protein